MNNTNIIFIIFSFKVNNMNKYTKIALVRAKINAKSLAAEAKFIKHEISKSNDKDVKDSLQYHRIMSVRPEARLTNLAIGFIKNKPRKQVEMSTKNFDLKRLTRKINVFYYYSRSVTESEVMAWYKNLE